MRHQTPLRILTIVKNIIIIPIIQKVSFLKLRRIKTRAGTVAKRAHGGLSFLCEYNDPVIDRSFT